MKALLHHRLGELGKGSMLQHDIEIVMRSGRLPQQGINPPATVQPHCHFTGPPLPYQIGHSAGQHCGHRRRPRPRARYQGLTLNHLVSDASFSPASSPAPAGASASRSPNDWSQRKPGGAQPATLLAMARYFPRHSPPTGGAGIGLADKALDSVGRRVPG